MDARLALEMEEMQMMDALLVVGTQKNSAVLRASAWQRIKQLQGMVPAVAQVRFWGVLRSCLFQARLCFCTVKRHPPPSQNRDTDSTVVL